MAAARSGKESVVTGTVQNRQEASAVAAELVNTLAAEMVVHLPVDILVEEVESHGNMFVEPLLVVVQ